MAKTQRLGANSAMSLVASINRISDEIPLPEGVILRDEDEMVIYRQFVHTRVREDWRSFDLILVAKLVRGEADIRRYQKMLDEEGAVILNERGTKVVNPLMTIIDSLQRMQLSIMRSMSMTQTDRDPRTMNGSGKKQGELRHIFDGGGGGDLLAKP